MIVLVVEDDPVVRVVHATALSTLTNITVLSASTIAEAKAFLDQVSPDLFILDLHLPDGTGLDLLDLLATKGIDARIIIVSSQLESFRKQLPTTERLIVINKPVKREVIREKVEALRSQDAPPPFSLIDYIQLACMSQHSVELRTNVDGEVASICVIDGQLWSAKLGKQQGVDALAHMLSMGPKHIEVRAVTNITEQRDIHDRWDHVLLELMRLRDEAEGDEKLPSPPPDAQTPGPPAVKTGLDFAQYVELATRAAASGDYATALEAFEQARKVNPDDWLVKHNIDRLKKHILRLSTQGHNSQAPHFPIPDSLSGLCDTYDLCDHCELCCPNECAIQVRDIDP